MLFRTLALSVVLALLGFMVATAAWADTPPVESIGGQLICMCGCNAVLPNCIHPECSVRDDMVASIKSQLSQGRSSSQIIASFVARYGEQVLSAPTKRGFNLTAWVMPFAAIALGGTAIYLVLKAWVLPGRVTLPAGASREAPELDPEYAQRLEKELEEFREGGRL